MQNGFFKLQRRFFAHWLWTEERRLSKAEAFLDLLQIAAFKPTKRTVRGKFLEIAEGEVVASLRYLAERWKWNKDAVSIYLEMLEKDKVVRRQTRQGESIIILCKYKDYMSDRKLVPDSEPDAQPDSGQTAGRQAADKYEEGEEPKDDRERDGAGARRPTLAQAKSKASEIGITEAKADEWWNVREASQWMKGMAGGGIAPVGSNWPADLKTYATRGGPGQNQKPPTEKSKWDQ